MKRSIFFIAFIFLAIGTCLFNPAYAQGAQQDTTKEGYPIYKNVDVTIEYAWSDMERYDKVEAIVKLVAKKPVAIIVVLPDGTKYEVTLIDEVTVKLFSHDTGKLIRAFGNTKAT